MLEPSTVINPPSQSTLAPKVSKTLICWSIGRLPKLHPPGLPT